MTLASSAEEQGAASEEVVEPANAEDASDLGVDANAADSSDADDKDANKGRSTLDVVTEALGEGQAEESSDSDDGKDGKSEAAAEETDADKADVEADGEKDEPPFHQHPRWKEVQTELKTLRPQAEAFQNLQGFMRETGLSVDEANQGFAIMAQLKSDPAKAYETLAPIVAALQQHVGVILPTDLQQKVDDGYMTEEDARDYARLRAQQQHGQKRTEAQEQQRQKAAQQQAVNASLEAIDAWEAEWKAGDPDYAVLNGRVAEKIQLEILTKGMPKTADEARAMAERIKADVVKEVGQFRPTPKPSKGVSNTGQSSSAANRPAPKSTLDVIDRALAGMAA